MDMNIQGVAYASLIAQIYGCMIGFIAIYKRGNLTIRSEYIQSLKSYTAVFSHDEGKCGFNVSHCLSIDDK